jgi:hypothetical protein
MRKDSGMAPPLSETPDAFCPASQDFTAPV